MTDQKPGSGVERQDIEPQNSLNSSSFQSMSSLISGSSVRHRLADLGRSVLARFTSTPEHSKFIEKGTLTPKEFLDAGDLLTFKFPTWQWQAASPGRESSWLPYDRQYLVTRNVASRHRVRDIEQSLCTREETDGGWLLPVDDDDANDQASSFCQLDSSQGDTKAKSSHAKAPTDSGIPDIKEFEDVEGLLEDEDDPAAIAPNSYFIRQAPDADIVSTRTYDLSITYDKYFQTPRIWLFGYDENGIPLTSTQIFEDILTDYVVKTVTVDPHPCTGVPTASIHPCRHAQVMKKVVDYWRSRGIPPRHDLALIVLLKFIASVIPTIDYDYTMDIDMGL